MLEVADPESPVFGVKVIIPEEALPAESIVSIVIRANPPKKPLPEGVLQEGVTISFNASAETFAKSLFIMIPFESNHQGDELRLVFTYDDTLDDWRAVAPLPTTDSHYFLTEVRHGADYVKGKTTVSSSSIKTGFNPSKDTHRYENDTSVSCLYDTSSEGICNGMALLATEYFNNRAHDEGESLRCRWNRTRDAKASCEAHRRSLGKHISTKEWFAYMHNITASTPELGSLKDYSYLIEYIKFQAKRNHVVTLGLIDADPEGINGHTVVATGWEKTGETSGIIEIYDVNDNSQNKEMNYIKTVPGTIMYYGNYSIMFPMSTMGLNLDEIVRSFEAQDCCADSDNDSIPDLGDCTKTINDKPCTSEKTQNCYDNCPDVSNPDQADSDGDGVGDACDEDEVLTWEKTFGGTYVEWARSVRQTADGGYIIVGEQRTSNTDIDVYLVKTDGDGNVLWEKTFGEARIDWGSSVRQTADGGYIIAGGTGFYGGIYLIKTDAEGNALWEKTFSEAYAVWDTSVQQTSDGGYVVVGGYYDVYLIKTDAEGNKIWQRTFGGRNLDKGYSVRQTTDGSDMITGEGTGVYLIKEDAEGNKIWQRTFGGRNLDKGYSVQQTTDGGYIIAAEGTGVYLIKTDAEGNKIWQRTFGLEYYSFGRSVEQTADGGYIIVGEQKVSNIDTDVYLIKIDAEGNKIWQRTFGGRNLDKGYSVQQTTDGGYIIVGEQSVSNADTNVYLLKTDTEGNKIWQRTFGLEYYSFGRSVEQTADGGYIIAGGIYFYQVQDLDFYLIKTDANGDIK